MPREKCADDSLSERERETPQLVVEGKTSAEITLALNLSPKSVETYRSRLMKKLGVKTIPALVKLRSDTASPRLTEAFLH